MNRSVFHISKMDCPSEERLIRIALDGKAEVKSLAFDLSNRNMTAILSEDPKAVLSLLLSLNLGASLKESNDIVKVS